MPIKKPLQTIKKKLGLEPTFKQKRESLGVKREFNDTRTRIVGGMIGNANKKVTQIEHSNFLKIVGLQDKLTALSAKKPKNELEARRKKEAILKLKEMIGALEIIEKNEISNITTARTKERKLRQGKLIENKLKSIIKDNPSFTGFGSDRIKSVVNSKIDILKLRENYHYLLKTKKITFADITTNDAVTLLVNSIIKK